MNNLMPKISSILEQTIPLKDYINKYQKIEIQFFRKEEGETVFNFETTIREYSKIFNFKEVTIHPPLEHYELEYILFRNKEGFLESVKKAVELSKELNIKINLLYHARWEFEFLKYAITDTIREAIEIIGDTNVILILENSTMVAERKHCSVLDFCEYIGSPKLKFCLDICHIYCQANMYKMDIYEHIGKYLDKDKCSKYLYQIHFSYTAKNDGYIDKKTHGIIHPNEEEVAKDIRILKDYAGFTDKTIWVTEVGEKNYTTREDQIQEIRWLEEIDM